MNAALILALSLGAPVEIGKDGKGDRAAKEALDKLQGVWKATAVESLGRAMPPAALDNDRYVLVVNGDAYVLLTHAGSVKLDPAKKTIDLVIAEGRYKGTTAPGLYELSGDTLKIALAVPSARGAGERPTELKSSAEGRHTLYTFEKDGKATREQAAARLKELTGPLARLANPPAGFALPAPPAGFAPPGAAAAQANEETLKKVLDKLEAIEKRLDAIEKRLPPAEKK